MIILRSGPILAGMVALVLGGCSAARFGGLDEPRYSGGPQQLTSERRGDAPARPVAPVYTVERTVEPPARHDAPLVGPGGDRFNRAPGAGGGRGGDWRDGSGYRGGSGQRAQRQPYDTSRYAPQQNGERSHTQPAQQPARRGPVYRRHVTGRWMGQSWVGRSTVTQEPFDPDRLTGAHATLPLPSYVYVTNRSNGRTVLVRVNDRPASGDGRDGGAMMLVSRRVADLLDFSRKGSAELELQFAGPAGLVSSGQHEEAFLRRQPWYDAVAGGTYAGQAAVPRDRGGPTYGASRWQAAPGVAGAAQAQGGGTAAFPRWDQSARVR